MCWRMGGGGGMRGIAGYAFEKGAYFVEGVVVLLLRLLRMLLRMDDAVDVAAAGDDGAHGDGARVGVVVVVVVVVDAAAVVGAAREDAAETGSTMVNGGSMALPLAGVETEWVHECAPGGTSRQRMSSLAPQMADTDWAWW